MKLLQSISKEHHFNRDEVVFGLNQPAEKIFQVITGEVQLYRIASDGKRVLIFRAYDGDYFAEASLYSDKYHCTAMCVKSSVIHSYDAIKVIDLLHKDQSFAMAWIVRLSAELRRQRASVERLNLNSASDRLTHYLLTEGDLTSQITVEGTLIDLAEILGLTKETLYRTLAVMEKTNLIERTSTTLRLI